MSKTALAIVVLVGVTSFAAGLAMPRPTAPPIPVAEPGGMTIPARAGGGGLDACKNELVNVKAQFAICLAYRAPPESPAMAPTPRPPPAMDEETARLVRTGTTNTETVHVRSDCGIMIYAPGTWPPPGGPPMGGSRIVSRKVDGGMEFYAEDGGVRFVASSNRPLFCPCPRDVDGGAETK